MAGKYSGLNHGAIMRIAIDGIPVAHALSHSFSVSVQITTTSLLGTMIPVHEAVDISEVNGQFTVINMLPAALRVPAIKKMIANQSGLSTATSNPNDIAGIRVGTRPVPADVPYVATGTTAHNKVQDGVELMQMSNIVRQLNPNEVFAARTFDIDRYAIVPVYNDATGLVTNETIYLGSVIDCNILGKSSQINMGDKILTNFSYHGKLAFRPRGNGQFKEVSVS